ncbi:hypothetical protein ABPG72_020033 [Tetrahymena utriculariae]
MRDPRAGDNIKERKNKKEKTKKNNVIKEGTEAQVGPHWSQWNSTASSPSSYSTQIKYFQIKLKKQKNFTIFRSQEDDIITKTFEEEALAIEHGYHHREDAFDLLEQRQGQKGLRVKGTLGIQLAQRLLLALDAGPADDSEKGPSFVGFLKACQKEVAQYVPQSKSKESGLN